ncbi:hypothetical protein BKA82DRAFT_4188250 [Pisolithus tinctorius]|nr:hypothetical protein BKA82DRAFT_4188250 [Pisolithus tinctorius]
MPTMMPALALQLALDITSAKDGCTFSMMKTLQLKGRTGETSAGEHIIEWGVPVLITLGICPNKSMRTSVAMTTSSSMLTFPDQSGLRR